jgi:hypothetical protein
LTVTSTIAQILSLVPDLLKVKLSSLCNLKSLEVQRIPLHYESLYLYVETAMLKTMLKKAAAKSRKEAAMLRKTFKAGFKPPPIPHRIIDFLRQNSPSAGVNITTGNSSPLNLKQVIF